MSASTTSSVSTANIPGSLFTTDEMTYVLKAFLTGHTGLILCMAITDDSKLASRGRTSQVDLEINILIFPLQVLTAFMCGTCANLSPSTSLSRGVFYSYLDLLVLEIEEQLPLWHRSKEKTSLTMDSYMAWLLV